MEINHSETKQGNASTTERSLSIVRISAGIIIAGECLAWYVYGSLGLLCLPVALGALIPLFQVRRWINGIEEMGPVLRTRRDRAREKNGKFARFFSRPLWSGSVA